MIGHAGDAAAMAGVLAHVAARNLAAAEAAMAGIGDAQLLQLDFAAWFEPFRAAGFVYGEGRIAPLFKAGFADNIFMRIRGVDCLIDIGAADRAVAELAELVLMAAALAHAGMLIACHIRLERFDLASALAQRLADSGTVPLADSMQVGYEIASCLAARGLRSELVHELHRLSRLCAGLLEPSVRVADLYLAAGEPSFAQRVLERLDERAVETPQARLCLLQAEHGTNREALAAALRGLAREPSGDAGFWLKLSYVAVEASAPDLALQAARNAVAHAPGDKVWARIRMAQMLTTNGQRRAAMAEVEMLVTNDTAMTFCAQQLAELAIMCERPALAVGIAKRWHGLVPADRQAQAMLCAFERKADDEPGVFAACSGVLEALRQGIRFTPGQFRLVLDSLSNAQSGLRVEIAERAAAQHPGQAEFATIARPDGFAAKFLGPVGAGVTKAPKPGLLARWLGRRSAQA